MGAQLHSSVTSVIGRFFALNLVWSWLDILALRPSVAVFPAEATVAHRQIVVGSHFQFHSPRLFKSSCLFHCDWELPDPIAHLDVWLKRRIRMCFWRPWRYPRTKIKHLVALGVTLDMAVKHAISRKKYWRMSGTPALRFAMTNEWLLQQGLVSLKQLWYEASLRGTA